MFPIGTTEYHVRIPLEKIILYGAYFGLVVLDDPWYCSGKNGFVVLGDPWHFPWYLAKEENKRERNNPYWSILLILDIFY